MSPASAMPIKPRSLRTRYLSLTLIMSVLVVSVVLAFYQETISTKQRVTEQLSALRHNQDILNALKVELLEVYRHIDQFLLDPSQGNNTEIAQRIIQGSITKTETFITIEDIESDEIVRQVDELTALLSRLSTSVKELGVMRMDIRHQYPGMAISAFDMTAPQHATTNNLHILIDEIESGDLEPRSQELYPLLLKSYALWSREISQMRIYLANRLASFSTDILISQAASLEDLHRQFMANVARLSELYSSEDSFEGGMAIEAIGKHATEWYQLFQQVRSLSESPGWRGDSHVMETVIIPNTNGISASIANLDKWFRKQESNVSEQYRETTSTLSTLLFAIIVLFFIFTIGLIYSLDLMVFRPIASVAQALKSKAFNHAPPALIANDSLEIRSLVGAFEQMDKEVNQRQSDLEHQALHDHLTGLPNRFLLTQRVDYHLLTSERNNEPFTLFMMDLNNFKDVNDSLGHAIGDRLLVLVSRLLCDAMRKTDTVARLGGDEFAILIPNSNHNDSELLAKKLLQQFDEPVNTDGRNINVGLSIGIVHYPEDGSDTQTLLQHADIAMYHAKRHKTGYAFYTSEDDFYHSNRLSLISELSTAIDRNDLEIHFQPLFDVASKTITGAEALLRWQHPEHGYIQPEKIIELAEYSGIIHRLSLWVLDSAVEQCAAWHKAGHDISVSVNLSVHDLSNHELCNSVAKILERHSLTPEYLRLEITESGMMENPARSIDILKSLNEMKINLAIDDFGTGFSSLSYLKRLPVNELKIDKSFVLDMDRNDSDEVIVQSTINLGHNLGLRVIAEGIEHQGLLDLASHLGCDQVQGYLFGKPQNGHTFLEFLGSYHEMIPANSSLQAAEQPA